VKSIPIPVFSYILSARTAHRKHSFLYCCVMSLLGLPHDSYLASPLGLWLLPSNGLDTDLQETRHVTAINYCVTSPRTKRKDCSGIVGRGRCLAMDLHVTILSFIIRRKYTKYKYVGFEVNSVSTMKSTVFWDVTPCNLKEINFIFQM
jgi:hypothetical protein